MFDQPEPSRIPCLPQAATDADALLYLEQARDEERVAAARLQEAETELKTKFAGHRVPPAVAQAVCAVRANHGAAKRTVAAWQSRSAQNVE